MALQTQGPRMRGLQGCRGMSDMTNVQGLVMKPPMVMMPGMGMMMHGLLSRMKIWMANHAL